MGLNTKISCADATLNFWIGCCEVSEACLNCYAKRWDQKNGKRLDGQHHWGKTAPRYIVKGAFQNLKSWRGRIEKGKLKGEG